MTNTPTDEDGKHTAFIAAIIVALAIVALFIPSPPDEVPTINKIETRTSIIKTVLAAENHVVEVDEMVVDKPVYIPAVKESLITPELHPNLKVICKCESGGFTHKDTDGVLLSGFIDSDDKGYCQINTRYHGDTMEQMGLDINDDADYYTYANHLYETQGRQPWSASSACWAPIIGYLK